MWKINISYPLIRTFTCAYQGVRNVRFSENLSCFVFLKHQFWDWPFCFIIDEISSRLVLWKPRLTVFQGIKNDHYCYDSLPFVLKRIKIKSLIKQSCWFEQKHTRTLSTNIDQASSFCSNRIDAFVFSIAVAQTFTFCVVSF